MAKAMGCCESAGLVTWSPPAFGAGRLAGQKTIAAVLSTRPQRSAFRGVTLLGEHAAGRPNKLKSACLGPFSAGREWLS